MTTVEYELGGQTWHLLLNGAAYFDILDKYGTEADGILEHIRPGDKAGFEATCWILAKLAEQGELWRRYQGYDNGPFLTAQRARAEMLLPYVASAKLAITEAVARGFARETKDPEPEYVDKTLQRLKKKGPAVRSTSKERHSFWGCLRGRRSFSR